jgi:anti-sigma28 factor (negative regulator of flagellin synthesis)
MPAPISQIAMTPDLQQHDIDLQRAQIAYANTLQPMLQVPIGSPISSTSHLSCPQILQIENQYSSIVNSISNNKGTLSATAAAQLNTQLQQKVLTLTEERDSLLEDKQVAELRDNILRSGDGAVTNHQIYLLGRPLRPASIPYIWALSVLFIGLGLLIFYTFFPYTIPPIDVLFFNLYFLFSNPLFWGILFALASIVILFLSLHIANLI